LQRVTAAAHRFTRNEGFYFVFKFYHAHMRAVVVVVVEVSHYIFIATISVGESEKIHTKENNV